MRKILKMAVLLCIFGCSKKLDLKPDSSLVLPQTIQDFENLLDNSTIMNGTPGFPQISADEYIIPTLSNFQSLFTPITRTAYIWEKDIYQGQPNIIDWNLPYQQIFISNSILDIVNKRNIENDVELKRIKGWALFTRAYAFYNLLSTFSKAYDDQSSLTDLGVPLKLSSDVAEILPRSTVKQSYDQVIKDATEASQLLQQDIVYSKRNRPSKVAAFAFLARLFISMRKYDQAEIYVDKSMTLYSELIDYNTLVFNATASSFKTYNETETIYFSSMSNSSYSQTSYGPPNLYSVNPDFYNLYDNSDLRKSIYFRISTNGNMGIKGINTPLSIPFTGLATDEMYIIKAECLARRGQTSSAMDFLNKLLKKRWNTSTPTKPYKDLIAATPEDALNKVLLERSKNLIWRSLRWTDLKRINNEGKNITITRNLGGTIYTLAPNSSKYVLPIPEDEIALSGLIQNIR